MKERWKTLDENPNYMISDHGNFCNNRGRLLKCNINARGYLYCNISTKGKVTKVKIHRLVAKYFVTNLDNDNTVNHIDGDKMNNHHTNLEWMTLRENMRHGWRTGLYKLPSKHTIRAGHTKRLHTI